MLINLYVYICIATGFFFASVIAACCQLMLFSIYSTARVYYSWLYEQCFGVVKPFNEPVCRYVCVYV